MITDPNGNVVSIHKYLPFGEELTPPPSSNTHEFTGHERDAETGLDYMMARYFGNASTMRFLSVDPSAGSISLLYAQSWNRYSYAANNPIRYLDPDGKHTSECHEKIDQEALEDEMSEEAIDDVQEGNVEQDTWQSLDNPAAEIQNQHGSPGKKADGSMQSPEEAAAGTAAFVGEKVMTSAEKALSGDIEGARKDMGAADHAVQDQGADGHGTPWVGLKDPKAAYAHGKEDKDLTSKEKADGVRATKDVHSSVISTIQTMGKAQNLTDSAVQKVITSFNGQ